MANSFYHQRSETLLWSQLLCLGCVEIVDKMFDVEITLSKTFVTF